MHQAHHDHHARVRVLRGTPCHACNNARAAPANSRPRSMTATASFFATRAPGARQRGWPGTAPTSGRVTTRTSRLRTDMADIELEMRIARMVESIAANEAKIGVLSTGEYLAVALVLDR